jgi:hypothetical protein
MAYNKTQITMRFVLPAEIRDGFPKLLDKVKKHVIREAIRSAMLPAKNSLKAKLLGVMARSRQSSGASYRAVTSKYKQHKQYEYVFYGIVGINRKLKEAIVPDVSPKYAPNRRQVSFGIKRRLRDGSEVFSRRYPRKEVKSSLRRKYGTLRLRWPNKYWHLLLYGAHPAHVKNPFRGYRFVEQVQSETEVEAQARFRAKVLEHFKRVFG